MEEATGLHLFQLTPYLYMLLRTILIFLFGVTLARFNKKLLGIRTPFNFLLFVMLGSLAANAIVDARQFWPILSVILLLTLLNGLFTVLSFYSPFFENFIKGKPTILVQEGKIQWKAMRNNFITERELLNELHSQLHTRNLQEVESAILESDGSINFTRK